MKTLHLNSEFDIYIFFNDGITGQNVASCGTIKLKCKTIFFLLLIFTFTPAPIMQDLDNLSGLSIGNDRHQF